MGIQGLLPLLKSIMSPIHVKELEGCCVAVDTYSWLHKGALSCSAELCKGLPTSRHIDYCMHRVNMLRHYGVKPILVFDGGPLPMKSEQENKRSRSRKENLARAFEHESCGNSSAAYECYQKAVDISPAIAYELIQVLNREGVHYIVAPYEADAQMTFLAVTKQVDAVITEDSDLIAFGCPRIIYKMDKFGHGVEFQFSMLQHNKDLSFARFTSDMLLEMCILSGCDYLPSLPGMGPKRAHALISKFKTFEKVIKHLRYSSVAVSPDYEKLFKKALLTFRHQRVYDPNTENIVHLTSITDDDDGDLNFLGPLMPQHTMKAIAIGELDPITKLPFQGDNVQNPALDTSYQLQNFRPESDKKKPDSPVQKNILTNYFSFSSLEAKWKYKIPRPSPKHSASAKESLPAMRKQVYEEAATCKINRSSELLNDPALSSDVNSPHNSIENKLLPEERDVLDSSLSREQNLLEQPGYSFHKPCLLLRKGHDHEHGSLTVPGTTNLQRATARLPCLQHKVVVEDDPNCMSNKVALRSSYFLDKCDGNPLDVKSKKIVVRSSYFKHNKLTTPRRINENNMLLVKDDASPVPTNFEGRRMDEDLYMKRKASPVHTNFEDNYKNKHARTEAYTEAEGVDVTDLMPREEKFGCNISHLGHYSDISGKSLDKFVSTISSFKYNSSGSRASGLRAPLRDVKNVHANRTSTVPIDIGKFAYVPNNGKFSRGTKKH